MNVLQQLIFYEIVIKLKHIITLRTSCVSIIEKEMLPRRSPTTVVAISRNNQQFVWETHRQYGYGIEFTVSNYVIMIICGCGFWSNLGVYSYLSLYVFGTELLMLHTLLYIIVVDYWWQTSILKLISMITIVQNS